MTMTTEQAAALRQPFPPEVIGKLPRSTCRACSDSQRKRCDQHGWVSRCDQCHGSHSSATMHLDYVGHAATTDRLLAVDPGWTWEPFALDAQGLPAVAGGNLWIRLTVCGVTRIGVGDGKSAKECIGDAIRNAAMRFGVALDLWSKEDLAGSHPDTPSPGGDQQSDPPEAGRYVQTPEGTVDRATGQIVTQLATRPAPESPLLNTSSRLAKRMFALLGEIGRNEKEDRLAYVSNVCGRPITSSTEMTDADAERVIAAIEADLQNPFPNQQGGPS